LNYVQTIEEEKKQKKATWGFRWCTSLHTHYT